MCNRGSRASLNPSPINMNPILAIPINIPGQTAARNVLNEALAQLMSIPQLATFGSPKPMKANPAIPKIVPAAPPKKFIIIGDIEFGTICLNMTLNFKAPPVFAALT